MSFATVADVSELTDDLPLAVDAGDFDVAIVRHRDQLYAIRDECSHGHVALSEGDVDDADDVCAIECYLHGSRFSLADGRALNLPATQPVPVFPVRIDGTSVQVDVDNPLNFGDSRHDNKEN